MTSDSLRSFIRFGLSGILATTTHVAVFVTLVETIHLRPLIASVPAFLTALMVSYILNYRWTFGAGGPHRTTMPKYFLVSAIGLLLNLLITWLVVDVWQFWYGFALMAVILLIPLSTFLLSKFWVFRG